MFLTNRRVLIGSGLLLSGVVLWGCRGPFDGTARMYTGSEGVPRLGGEGDWPRSVYRMGEDEGGVGGVSESLGLLVLDESASVDDYLHYAAINNPGLEAAFQRWLAEAERVVQVGALPDPKVTFGIFVNEVETRTGPQQGRVGIAQRFPWFGKLKDREDAAAFRANAAWEHYQAVRLELYERVTMAIYELAYVQEAQALTSDNLELLKQFEGVVRARYRVSAAKHPDLIRVQVELGKLEDRLAQLMDLEGPAAARVNRALNRPVWTPVIMPRLSEQRYVGTIQALSEEAKKHNPELRKLAEQVDSARAQTEVARKDGYPDVTMGLTTIITDEAMDSTIAESGDDPVLLSLSMNVPWDRKKYDAKVRESMARRLAIVHDRTERANRLDEQLKVALFKHEDGIRRVGLYSGTLLPKARESLEASFAAYRGGESDFFDLLDTEQTLLSFELALVRARTDRAVALAQLERLTGVRLGEQTTTETNDEAEQEGNQQ